MSSDEQKPAQDGGNPAAHEPAPEGVKPAVIERRLGCGWTLVLIILFVAAAGEAVYIFRDRIFRPGKTAYSSTGERKILYWQDPMHPQYKSDKPGTAPDCGMDLVPVYAEQAEAKPTERKVLFYTCSMHPEVLQDKPGDCPKCGMKLVEKR